VRLPAPGTGWAWGCHRGTKCARCRRSKSSRPAVSTSSPSHAKSRARAPAEEGRRRRRGRDDAAAAAAVAAVESGCCGRVGPMIYIYISLSLGRQGRRGVWVAQSSGRSSLVVVFLVRGRSLVSVAIVSSVACLLLRNASSVSPSFPESVGVVAVCVSMGGLCSCVCACVCVPRSLDGRVEARAARRTRKN
jgi:hypothetical protein